MAAPGAIRFQATGLHNGRLAVNLRSRDARLQDSLEDSVLPVDEGAVTWDDIPPGAYWLVISNDKRYAFEFPTGGSSRILPGIKFGFQNLVATPYDELVADNAAIAVARVDVQPGQTADLGEVNLIPLGRLRGQFPDHRRQTDPGLYWLDWELGEPSRGMGWGALPPAAYGGLIRLSRSDRSMPYFDVPVYFDGTVYARVPVGQYDAESRPNEGPPHSLGTLTITADSETVLSNSSAPP
jgi:hypothetical protein